MPDDTQTRDRADTKLAEIERRIDRGTANALAVSRNAGGTFSVAPQSMGELMEFAKLMSVSGICVRPTFRGNPGACLAVALQAFRCGGDPFAWANKAYIVNDQIVYEAQLVHAIVNSSSVLQRRLRPFYEGEGADRRCRIVGFVKGEDEPLEYESPPIGNIAVKNSPLWKGDPDQQLFYYSSRAWARRHVPEILLGIYAPDEFGETIDVTPRLGELDGLDDPPRRLSATREPQRPPPNAAAPSETPAEFEITDLDGVVRSFENPAHAATALRVVLQEAARMGIDRLDGAWESNLGTAERLAEHGAPLIGEYVDLSNAAIGAPEAMHKFATAEVARQREEEAAQQPASGDDAAERSTAGEVPPLAGPGPGGPAPAVERGISKARKQDPGAGAEPKRTAQADPRTTPAASAIHLARQEHSGRIPATGTNQPPPATLSEDGTRPSRAIAPVMRQGKHDWRAWAVALFKPKLRQQQTTYDLAWLFGDNADNLEQAKAALPEAERADLERAITEQWAKVDAGEGASRIAGATATDA